MSLSSIISQINNLTGYNIPSASGVIISSSQQVGSGSVNNIINYINSITGYNVPNTNIQYVSGSNIAGPVVIYTPLSSGDTISTEGIVPGRIIRAEHVLRIIYALSGITDNTIIVSGSFLTSGSNVLNGTLSLPFIDDQRFLYVSGGYVVGVDLPPSASFAISSSYSVSSSFATNALSASYFSGSVSNADFATVAGLALAGSGSFTGSFNGDLIGTASWAFNAVTASFALNGGGGGAINITGSNYFVAVFSGSSALKTGSIYDSGSFTAIGANAPTDPANPDRLFIDAGDTDSYNLLSGHGTIDGYLQINIQNFSPGSTGSSDIVATADNGDETNYYIDMGINGSGYSDPNGVGNANDAYLYSTGQDLLIGNATPNHRVIIFNGEGPALDNARLYITSQGTVGVNASDANLTNPEALLVEPLISGSGGNTFSNLIIGKGTVNESYLQLNMINLGTGSYASADIVASNDVSTETSNYIDMGINSSLHTFDPSFAPGTGSDTYLLSTGRDLLIGSATSGSITLWTSDDFNNIEGAKLKLNYNNQHEVSGSLSISGSVTSLGFTGSLLGTASWASNALTASTAPNIYNSNGTLTGARILGLSGSSLDISGSTTTRFFANGRVGIGTITDSGFQLDVNGTIRTNASITMNSGINIGTALPVKTMSVNAIVIGFQQTAGSTQAGDILIGTMAGNGLNGSIGNNILIGREAGGSLVTGNKNLVIGSYVGSSAFFPLASNSAYKLLVGNLTGGGGGTLLGGDMINGQFWVNPTTTDILTLDPSVAFGINGQETIWGGLSTFKGFLPPVGTAANRTGISTPRTGLQVYQSDSTEGQYVNLSNGWQRFLTTADTGSLSVATASFAISSSQAATASFAPAYLPLTGGTINGNVTLNGTASIAFLNVTYQSSSIIYSSGSNQFGDATDDTQTLIGTVIVSGSQQITGSLNVSQGITGSLFGTASYANNALTSSYPIAITGSTIYSAGSEFVNPVGSVFLGPNAGSYAINAEYSTFIGYNAGANIEVGSVGRNNIIIGNFITLAEDARDSINIGGIIFGTGSWDGAAKGGQISSAVDSGRIGILTAQPEFTLDVSGSGRYTNGLTVTGSFTVITGSSREFQVRNTGVDIGNVISDTHTVTGSFNISGSLNAPNITGSLFGTASWAQNIITSSLTSSFVTLGTIQTISGSKTFAPTTISSGSIARGTNFTPILSASANNDVLVGLDITPTFSTGSFTGLSSFGLRLAGGGTVAGNNGGQLQLRQSDTVAGGVIGMQGGGWQALGFWGATRYTTTSTPDLRIFGNGVVRTSGILVVDGNSLIGTSIDAGFRLDVSGTARISGNQTLAGNLLLSSSLYAAQGATGSAATITNLVSVPTGSYTAGFFDYTVSSGSNARAGTVMSVWNGTNVQFTDNSTLDIGNTNDVTMSAILSGGNIQLRSTTTAFQWIVKTTYRLM